MKFLWLAIGVVVLLWCCSIDRMPRPQTKTVAAKAQIDSFLTALDAYREDVGDFPTTEEGLEALREDPGHGGWNGPYLAKDIPRDPWGAPYIYIYPGTHGKRPDLISLGADREPGGKWINADIVSWQR